MALILHYPLNKGLNDSGPTGNHLQYKNNAGNLGQQNVGKLGRCQERTGYNTTDYYRSTSKINLSGEFTLACWARVTQCHPATANGLVTNHSHSSNTGPGITVKHISDTDFRLSCNTGTGSGRTYHSYYGTTNIKDKWCHLVMRYDGTTITLWVNGVIERTQAYSMACIDDYLDLFNWSTTNSGSENYRPVARLNDVRVYDHACSEKEIKELAKGKMMHYTFNDRAHSGIVDMPSWSPYSPYSTLVERSATSWVTKGVRGGNSTIAVNHGYAYPVGTIVRVSGYMTVAGAPVAISNATTYATTLYSENNPETGWFSIVEQFTSATSWLFHAPFGYHEIGDEIACRDILVENLSSDAGNGGYLRDSSGMGHDSDRLTIAPSSSEFTALGTRSGKFFTSHAATMANITGVYGPQDVSTVSGWVYLTKYSSDQSPVFENGPYLNVNSTGKVKCYWHSKTSPGYHAGSITVPLNTWTMITAAWSASAVRIYVNGVFDKQYSTSGTGTSYANVRIGHISSTRSYDGYIADARRYATTLSDADIMELYESKANVDSNGDLRCSELMTNGYQRSLVDYTTWKVAATNAPGLTYQPWSSHWDRNGSASENMIRLGKNPVGESDIMWASDANDVESGADGGFVGGYSTIDRTKTYRCSIWIRRRISGNGSWYFGCHANNIETLAGTTNTNPYFKSSGSLMNNEWFLIVAYVFPTGTTTNIYTDGAIYDVDGNNIGTVTNFRFSSTATQLRLRSYLYYSTSTTTSQEFYRPRMDLMDGSQPPLDTLLKCAEHRPLHNAIDYDYDNKSIESSGVANFIDASEVGVTDGLMGYWNLADLKDKSKNRNDLTLHGSATDGGDNRDFAGGGALTAPYNSTFDVPAGVMTMIALIKVRAIPTTGELIIVNKENHYEWHISTLGYFRRAIYPDWRWDGTLPVPVGEKVVVASVWQPAGDFMYVNGVKETVTGGTRGNIPKLGTTTNGFAIGDRGIASNGTPPAFTTNEFNGNIYEVKLFSRALSDEEIAIETKRLLGDASMQIHDSGTIYTNGFTEGH